jgi:uncharacterized membrane protein YgcG
VFSPFQRWAQERGNDPTRAIFMIVAVNDRKMVVMPARALGLEYPLARREIADDLPPLFRERRYYDALMTLTERVHLVIHQSGTGTRPR